MYGGAIHIRIARVTARTSRRTHPGPEARVIAASWADKRAISVYVPNGKAVGTDKYQYKLDWMKRLRAYLHRCYRTDQAVALCGDFNVAPEDRDIYDPALWTGRILCSQPERDALHQVLDWGLVMRPPGAQGQAALGSHPCDRGYRCMTA